MLGHRWRAGGRGPASATASSVSVRLRILRWSVSSSRPRRRRGRSVGFDTVSREVMQAARLITGVTMAIVIGVGLMPPLRPYARRIRLAALALYLLGFVAFVGHIMIGP